MDYQELFEKVKEVIIEHDPINLASHAPDDEYDSEVAYICPMVGRASSAEELSEKIYNLFVDQFDKDTAGDKRKYTAIAEKIFALSK